MVARFQVLPDRVKTHRCECCGGDASIASGYLYDDGEPRGVYLLDWTEGHAERSAALRISMGDWSDGATADKRRVVGVEILRNDEGEVGFRLAERPYRGSESLGRWVGRRQALATGHLADFWRLTDQIALEDPRVAGVIAWIRGERETALLDD